MANKKDIGNAYKEQLDTYKVSPHNRVWDRIEEELDKKENKRIAYWKFSSGALLLLLLVSSVLYFYKNNQTEHTNTYSIENINEENNSSTSNHNPNNSLKETPYSNKETSNSNITNTLANKNNVSTPENNSSLLPKNDQKNTAVKNSTPNLYKNIVINSNNSYVNNIEDYGFIDILPLTYSALIDIPKAKKNREKKKNNDSKKFYIKPIVGINHFGSLKKGSAIDETLNNNSKKSEVTFNYGIGLVYDLSKHSSVSFGIQYTKLSSTTKAADSTNFDSTLKYSPSFQNIDLYNSTNSYPSLGSLSEIDFKQQLSYLEFPLQYYYTHSKSNLRWTFFGGVGFLALVDDDIIAKSSNGNTLRIGTANNLSKISLSLNIGSGLNYVISEKLKLHIEPTFKYYINTYNRNSNVTPYSINLNIGMSYKF